MEFSYDELVERNKKFMNEFQHSKLMLLINDPSMEQLSVRESLLDCIQVFSDYFQKTVMLRHVFSEKKKFVELSKTHLDEEYGHNDALLKDRNNKLPIWDPILESTASWFCWKMFLINDIEKLVLVHLILEESANIFFQKAHQVMRKYQMTNYFERHAELDEGHATMGNSLLVDLKKSEYTDLYDLQQKGWDVLITTCDRMAELVKTSSQIPTRKNTSKAKETEQIL